jgi:DNA-binding NtrC family response regulator
MDLDKACQDGTFRLDLMYRLKSVHIHLPPLRERDGDIPLLADHFLHWGCQRHGKELSGFTPEAMAHLQQQEYPGNIRELKSIVQAFVNVAQGRPISTKHLPENLRKQSPKSRRNDPSAADAIATLDQIEKRHILSVYEQMDRNKSRTARALGIGLNTLRRKLESYGEK